MAPKRSVRDRSEEQGEEIMSTQDGVLRKVYDLYRHPTTMQNCGDKGIVEMAKEVGIVKLCPRNKATVMILGNHSSGKSSFINWYLKENVLPTGAAVESRGFTLVTSSVKEAPPLKGEATLRYFPQLKGIEKFGKGLIENLSTIVSVSQERCFPNVDFIDTPGLVDGSVEYPFDVNRVLLFLADYVDLIFVFLDPHEQALGSRTMEVVKMLNVDHYDKMCYYLTKIDTLNSIADLMKVSNQTTQNLALRVKNTHGWELPTIYLTQDDNSDLDSDFHSVNMISKPCDRIDLVVKQKIQDNLGVLEKDCTEVLQKTEKTLRSHVQKKTRLATLNRLLVYVAVLFGLGLLGLLLYLMVSLLDTLPQRVAQPGMEEAFQTFKRYATRFLPAFDLLSFVKVAGGFVGGNVALFWLIGFVKSFYVVLSKDEVGSLQANRRNLKNMLSYREELYNLYIRFLCVCYGI
ncbi:hypothetical protein WA588_004709 [Blastocystis sp. NMH]